MNKKAVAIVLAASTALSLAACGSSTSSTGTAAATSAAAATAAAAATSAAADGTASSGAAASITLFNSKMEIQDQFETLTDTYEKATGVHVECYYSSDTVASHIASKYAANDPYTIMMVDAKDVYSLGPQYAADLSSEKWVSDTNYAIQVDGKTLGFPFCVEARGLMYNGDAIKKITGEDFDPTKYETLDSFKELLAKLVAGGMASPVGIMKEDWSLGAHYFQEVYEERDDVDSFISSLKAGTEDLTKDAKFNSLMDTFDVLKENNYAKDSAISAERETSEMKLAQGDIAFMFGGNWDWAEINQYDYTDGIGMMPVPQNTDDGSNTKLVGGGSKYFMIDSSDATNDAERQAAKDFLNWLVSDPQGQSFLVNDCSLVPAFKSNTLAVQDPLGASVKQYADAGNLIANYNYDPDDHYSKVGASMQKYLADQIDRAGLATEVEDYWKSVK
ncbi:MAG: ABC transporter substrate-binding protein [Lachnospiraceae bacterium]|jgi:raffinose/stachyose/melibiose transport system substrate-binding protein|nr:ABC transporter substrate-binding protein [Lachnospiraceae bacterium]